MGLLGGLKKVIPRDVTDLDGYNFTPGLILKNINNYEKFVISENPSEHLGKYGVCYNPKWVNEGINTITISDLTEYEVVGATDDIFEFKAGKYHMKDDYSRWSDRSMETHKWNPKPGIYTKI